MTPTRLSILFLLVVSMTASVRSADPKPGSDWPAFEAFAPVELLKGFRH
jgi:hypothetical protein